MPTPPSWLDGVRPVRHIRGQIWEIELKGYGKTVVGPYNRLQAYTKSQGLGEDAHHIVGKEHLGDVKTRFTDRTAPAVALEKDLHRKLVSSRITAEQGGLGGRPRGGRTVVTRSEVGELYSDVYRFHTPFEELATISENILELEVDADPGSGSGSRHHSVGSRGVANRGSINRGTGRGLSQGRTGQDQGTPRGADSLSQRNVASDFDQPNPRPRASPDIDVNLKLRPLKVGFRFARGVLIDQIVSLALGYVLSLLEAPINEENQRSVRRSWRDKVFPFVEWVLGDEIRMSIAGEQPAEKRVYIGVRWTIITREQADELADAAVFVLRFATGNPGFVELFERIEVQSHTKVLKMTTRRKMTSEAGKRQRDEESDNLIRYPQLQWILVHDPTVLAAYHRMTSRLVYLHDLLRGVQAAYLRMDPDASLNHFLLAAEESLRQHKYITAVQNLNSFEQGLTDKYGRRRAELEPLLKRLSQLLQRAALERLEEILDGDQRALLSGMIGAPVPGFFGAVAE